MSAVEPSLWWTLGLTAIVATAGVFLLKVSILPRVRDRQFRREFDADSFDPDTLRQATVNYVHPDCSRLDPSGAHDRQSIVQFTRPLIPTMDGLLSGDGAERHFLLLADSGMGKTTFLLNYFKRNGSRPRKTRLRLVLVPLGRPDVLKKLDAVERKSDTIALLDGLDEDVGALEDPRRRIDEIMSSCADFARVVISCRTEFAASDRVNPPEDGVTFERIYLAPFSDRQIDRYLRRCLPWYQWRRRRQARQLVATMPELMARPMLLSLVPELVTTGRTISELFELYEFMVERWLERESGWIAPDILRAVSKRVAVALYLRSSRGGSDRMTLTELTQLVNLEPHEVERWQLTTRSLLNRDAMGNFRFAQRSVMEYLFVCAFADGEPGCLHVRWSDFMRQLFLSWAIVVDRAAGEAGLRDALSQDFTATGVFPLTDHQSSPAQLNDAQILNTAQASGLNSPRSSLTWKVRRLYVTEHRVDDSTYVCDRASDTIFCVAPDWRMVTSGVVDSDTANLFLFTRTESDHQLRVLNERRRDNRSNWRFPTLDELDRLYLWNLSNALLPSQMYIWTADHTEDGHRLLGRMCDDEGDDEPRVKVIGRRRPQGASRDSPGYLVSSVPPLGTKDHRGHFDMSFRALAVRVSQGAAESFVRDLPLIKRVGS